MQPSRLDIDLLLTTASAEFARSGFEGTSMRHLAELCGVTQPAIYYHFSSKEMLYEEVCRNRFDEIARVVDLRVAGADSAEAKLEAFISSLYDEWHRDNTLLLLTQREAINALISPGRCVAMSHTVHLFGHIDNILTLCLGHAVDEDTVFSFGALLFGFCSLMGLDFKGTSDLDTRRQRRKAVLLARCKTLLQDLRSS